MRETRQKLALLAVLVAFAANGIACGQITTPMTLALDSEASSISLSLLPSGVPLGTTTMEGGVATEMTMTIGLFDLLFQRPFNGVIEVTDLLFGGTSLNILGTDTGTLCTFVPEGETGGGSALVDIWDEFIQFDMLLPTTISPTNPDLLALLPDGFPFEMMFSDTADLSLADLLALAFGNADGGLTVAQPISEELDVVILGLPLTIGVDGQIAMETAGEFPTGALLDECIAFLAP